MLHTTNLTTTSEKKIEIFSGEEENTVLLYSGKVKRYVTLDEAVRIRNIWDRLPESIKLNFVSTNFQAFPKDAVNTFLEHERIEFISYPHEWCSIMFKDACVFHLELFKKLIVHQMTFKDFHLWNILPQFNNFKFVDIPSIEKYILNTDNVDNINLLTWYFNYYLLMPLLGHAFGDSVSIKKHIFNTTLNTSTHVMKLRDCISFSGGKIFAFKKVFGLLLNYAKFKKLDRRKNNLKLIDCVSEFEKIIKNIPLKNEQSGYVKYYEEKGEMSDYHPNSEWNLKQQNIYEILNDTKISTVLDVGCNIGWYSVLAAKIGKQVVSIDNDVCCVNALYKFSLSQNLSILPLCISVGDLHTERYAPTNGKKVLLSFVDRVQCDLVYVLGLIHHLILGLGYDIDELLKTFSKLATKKLIIEFVDLDDEKIVQYPEFFEKYHKNPEAFSSYSLDTLLSKSKHYFSDVEILPSYPHTRKLVVLTK